jgi:hypothetical protein
MIESLDILKSWRLKIRKLPAHSVVPKKELAELYFDVCKITIPKEWDNAQERYITLSQTTNADYWSKVVKNFLKELHAKHPDAESLRVFPGDLYNAKDILDVAEAEQKKPIIAEAVHSALFELEMAIEDELRSRKFVMLDSEESKLFNSKKSWLNRIAKKLPVAKKDLVIAGNCLAMNFHTAAVFHSMRAAEIGMRDLGIKLQAQPMRKKQNILIEEADWCELLRAINSRIESECRLLPANRTIIKSGFRDFRLLTQHLDILKNTRNDVMHTHDFYNKSEAYGIFERVKHFLQKLVEKI